MSDLNELLYQHCPELTDVQHIKFRQVLEAYIAEQNRLAMEKVLEIIDNGLDNDVPKQHILFAVQKFCEDGNLAALNKAKEE